jgi:putative membrane protein
MAGSCRFPPEVQVVPEHGVRVVFSGGAEESNMDFWTGLQPLVLAQDAVGTDSLLRHLVAAVVFSVIGVAVLLLCVWVIDRLLPIGFRREILEDQNSALGMIVGALLIGISIIIAAAIHG